MHEETISEILTTPAMLEAVRNSLERGNHDLPPPRDLPIFDIDVLVDTAFDVMGCESESDYNQEWTVLYANVCSWAWSSMNRGEPPTLERMKTMLRVASKVLPDEISPIEDERVHLMLWDALRVSTALWLVALSATDE